jgi:HEAT repeat protein
MTDRWIASMLAIVLGCSACGGPSSNQSFQVDEYEDEETVATQPPEYWASRLDDPSAAVRQEALAGLGEAGREAADHAHRVASLLADPDERTGFTAAWALAHIGMGAHPLLFAGLRSPNPRVRERAAYGVSELGSGSGGTVDSLKPLTTDRDREVRSMAIWAIGHLESAAMIADPTMILREGLDGTRAERLQAIDRLGARARSSRVAVRTLIVLLSDSVPGVRARAIEALSEAGPSVLPSLSAALSHRNLKIRRGALAAISKMHRSF